MDATSAKVRTQKLRDFTVQIRDARMDQIVGTGIAVSMDGQIVTCAHVVEAALGVHPRHANGAEVGVYFPQTRGGEDKSRRATVATCFRQHDDDVVLLQLVGSPVPLGPEQIAVLGTVEQSEGYPFRSYGYCSLDHYPAAYARGTIIGCVECPEGRNLQADPVQLESSQIGQGMSGAGVLDTERNLVIGIISETWLSRFSAKHRNTAWAVNARVLTFDPLNLPLRDDPLEKRPALQPKTDIEAARAAVASDLGIALNNAPAPLPEWVGRADLLKAISEDWANPDCRVTGLIGFGGEGKSSLARRWLDDLLKDESQPQPDGVFWWGFYERRNVDEFFEAALKYMSSGRIDPREYPSTNARAHLIAAMLTRGRHLFILDGLEVMQHQEGDQYGLLTNTDLRDFLSFLAAPEHDSFCLFTSRAPLLDLMEYTTYTHRDVTRLSEEDGRALLRKVGVKGDDEKLDKVVSDWDGHALILSLLGAYLADLYGGDVAYIKEIPPPTADEARYERVHRVLRRYDEHLTDAERAFLMIFSAFRTLIKETAFAPVFRAEMGPEALNAPLTALNDAAFEAMVERLVAYRLLRYDRRERHYTAHPLIRAHYSERLGEANRSQIQAVHERIKDYHLSIAGDTPENPTLDDLAPVIEAVHHACRAGAYDEAERIRWERIYKGDRRMLVDELGAWEIALALMLKLFPDGDTTQEPLESDPRGKRWMLNEVGLCLMNLGRLGEAPSFFERKNAVALGMGDWVNASIGYQSLALLRAHLGALVASAEAARRALDLARRAEDKQLECFSLACQAWAAYLRGEVEAAGETFQQAEALEREIDPTKRYLYSLGGIQHANYLRRAGEAAYARRVTEVNLKTCERNHWANFISQCHCVLGDLEADAGQHESAREHYDEALKIARSISDRATLIEALLGWGRWAARHLRDAAAAFSDLNEALGYAVESGYRIYEADIRVGLAWAHLAVGDVSAARAEAERARSMSVEMGYHWGQVDAAEVLAECERSTG